MLSRAENFPRQPLSFPFLSHSRVTGRSLGADSFCAAAAAFNFTMRFNDTARPGIEGTPPKQSALRRSRAVTHAAKIPRLARTGKKKSAHRGPMVSPGGENHQSRKFREGKKKKKEREREKGRTRKISLREGRPTREALEGDDLFALSSPRALDIARYWLAGIDELRPSRRGNRCYANEFSPFASTTLLKLCEPPSRRANAD